ncbi:MAG: paraquat-inducible protein A, partial [Betaproteobacteria bacterium]|nr:paraquat-inducible protein A [Betaproteobacteria bacterium]
MSRRHTAASRLLAVCEVCGRLATLEHNRCPRCQSPLHLRKPDSLARTWALMLAAYVLYLPANLLPIMETRSPFGTQRDTIMSGVVVLWDTGSWELALVVFC